MAGVELDPVEFRLGLAHVLQGLGMQTDEPVAVSSRYRIEELIGEGAFGRVYRALDIDLDRPVALKSITIEAASALAVYSRVRAEARALAAVSHPGIVEVFDILCEPIMMRRPGVEVLIAMELVDGETLEEWVDRHRPSADEIIDAYCQAADALAAAHARGIVHRDFKPTNVMRRHDGRVVVLDFGVASLVRPKTTELDEGDGEPSIEGMHGVVGTPAYMAPEQHRGDEVTTAADVYAFGASLYRALTGHLPFRGPSLPCLYAAKTNAPLHQSGLSRPLFAALSRAMACTPEDRWSSMQELRVALRRDRRRLSASKKALLAAGSIAALWVTMPTAGGSSSPSPEAANTADQAGLVAKAQAHLDAGMDARQAGESERACDHHALAYETAVAAHADDLALQAAVQRIHCGTSLEDVERLGGAAEALADRLEPEERVRARLLAYRGQRRFELGDEEGAYQDYAAASHKLLGAPDDDAWACQVFVRAVLHSNRTNRLDRAELFTQEVTRRLDGGTDDVICRADAGLTIGTMRSVQGRLAEAEQQFRMVLETATTWPRARQVARQNLAEVLGQQERFDEALALLEPAAGGFPEEAAERDMTRARVLGLACRPDEAWAAWRTARIAVEAEDAPGSPRTNMLTELGNFLEGLEC